jgi:ferredoxin, 2Fe-2S
MVVRVEPLGIDLAVGEGETLLEAAARQGYYWPTICGGEVECGACFCEVTGGGDLLDPAERREATLLCVKNRLQEGRNMRLACCIVGKKVGGVRVNREGVRAK